MRDRIGKYRLERRLSAGGMGEVYRAVQSGAEGFEKLVALKVLLPQHQQDQELVDAFIDEATLAAQLNHPNIVSVYDFGCVDDVHFMAMELVEGIDLATLIAQRIARKQPLELRVAAYIAREICEGLTYVHDKQIVHRDVTPRNIFIGRDGQIKLGDFGIAKGRLRRTQTATGTIKGKLSYLAPEQVRGDEVTAQTDLYMVGLILYELLTGQKALTGDRDIELLQKALDLKLPPPSELRAEAGAFDQVISKVLQRHPMMRYDSAKVMARSIGRAEPECNTVDRATIAALIQSSRSTASNRPGQSAADETIEVADRHSGETVAVANNNPPPVVATAMPQRVKPAIPYGWIISTVVLAMVAAAVWLLIPNAAVTEQTSDAGVIADAAAPRHDLSVDIAATRIDQGVDQAVVQADQGIDQRVARKKTRPRRKRPVSKAPRAKAPPAKLPPARLRPSKVAPSKPDPPEVTRKSVERALKRLGRQIKARQLDAGDRRRMEGRLQTALRMLVSGRIKQASQLIDKTRRELAKLSR